MYFELGFSNATRVTQKVSCLCLERGVLQSRMIFIVPHPRPAIAQLDIPLSKEEARGAFDSIDTDRSDYVSMDEFVSFFKRKATEIAEMEVRQRVQTHACTRPYACAHGRTHAREYA